MAEAKIELGILNVVAHPHGEGVYGDLLRRAAGVEVNYWGDLNAALRKPREIEPGYYQSHLIIGTEIDLSEPLIDRSSLDEIQAQDADIRISENHLYNGRVFLYIFCEESHLFFFETKNEFGKRLSPKRAQKILSLLLSPEVLGESCPDVDVTIVPEDDSLDRLLGIEQLDRVSIHLQRPNPGDVSDEETAEVLAGLEQQGAKAQDLSLVRRPGAPKIVLNAHNYLLARVAQFNGFVSAKGVAEDGERVDGSTKQYPRTIQEVVDITNTAGAVALRYAKQLRIGRGQRKPDSD